TDTRIGQQRYRGSRLQEHPVMARMARFGSRLAALGSLHPALALFREGIGCRRPTRIGRIPVQTGFKGLNLLQEGEDLVSHAYRRLPPILSWDAESIRKGDRIQQKQGAHGAVSSYLVRPFLAQSALSAAWQADRPGTARCQRASP